MKITFGAVVVEAESYEAALRHFSLYHPREFAEYDSGRLDPVIDDVDVQASVATARSEEQDRSETTRSLADILLDHENRLRALEGKEALGNIRDVRSSVMEAKATMAATSESRIGATPSV